MRRALRGYRSRRCRAPADHGVRGRRRSARAGSAPSTNGIGPITLAIGKDNAGWLQGVITGWNKLYPEPEGHPAAAPRGLQRPAGPAGREPAGQERRVRRHRHGRHLDRGVRLERLDHPAAGEPVPAGRLPQARRRHRHVPGPAVRRPRLQQRRSALLPQGHPRQGGPAAAHDLGPAAAARRDGGPEVRARRVRRHVRPVRGPHGQLRRGGPVGREGRSSPRTAPRSRWTRPRRSTGWTSWSTGSPGLDPARPTLGYEEESRQAAFESGKFMFLDNWPDVSAALPVARPAEQGVREVRDRRRCRARTVPGSSSLGGANLAISAFSQHQQTALTSSST